MNRTVSATFENGYLRPDEDLGIASGAKVRITVETSDEQDERVGNACAELDKLCAEVSVNSSEPLLTRDQLHDRR